MVYLPTFTIRIGIHGRLHIPVPWMVWEWLGKTTFYPNGHGICICCMPLPPSIRWNPGCGTLLHLFRWSMLSTFLGGIGVCFGCFLHPIQDVSLKGFFVEILLKLKNVAWIVEVTGKYIYIGGWWIQAIVFFRKLLDKNKMNLSWKEAKWS